MLRHAKKSRLEQRKARLCKKIERKTKRWSDYIKKDAEKIARESPLYLSVANRIIDRTDEYRTYISYILLQRLSKFKSKEHVKIVRKVVEKTNEGVMLECLACLEDIFIENHELKKVMEGMKNKKEEELRNYLVNIRKS